MTVWLNGGLMTAEEARIAPTDRGFLLGDGLFETLRISGGVPLLTARHLARLRGAAGYLDLPIPHDDETLVAAIVATAAADGIAEGSVRLTVARGSGPRGLSLPPEPTPTVLITAGGLPPDRPAVLITATVTRRDEYSPTSRMKTLNYLDGILAKREADGRGADDALLLNTSGRAAETTVSNLFALIDDVLVTPPLSEGVLPGVRRSVILERLPVEERPITPGELSTASAIVLTNSLTIRAVASLDGTAPNAAESARLVTDMLAIGT